MVVDPLQLIVDNRPRLTADPDGGRPAPGLIVPGDLDSLSGVPGTPGYQRKMELLRQQSLRNGDPEEIRAIQREQAAPDPNLVYSSEPPVVVQPASAAKRVAVYNGKGDLYNVVVESAPDWETDAMLRGLREDEVNLLLQLVKALGVRLTDKTGEFLE